MTSVVELRDVGVAFEYFNEGMGWSRGEKTVKTGRYGLPSVFHLHFEQDGGRTAEGIAIVHCGGSARGLRERLIIAKSVEVANIEFDKVERTIVPLHDRRVIVVLKLLLRAKSDFIPITVDVRDANALERDVVQCLDLGGEGVPGGPLGKGDATDETVGRFRELE